MGLSPDIWDRVLATVPWLEKVLDGRQPEHEEVLRRNVACQSLAPGLRVAEATSGQLRQAQRGPRLGTRNASQSQPLLRDKLAIIECSELAPTALDSIDMLSHWQASVDIVDSICR